MFWEHILIKRVFKYNKKEKNILANKIKKILQAYAVYDNDTKYI